MNKLLFVLFLLNITTQAFAADDAWDKLIKATCLKCTYVDGTMGDWIKGDLKLEKCNPVPPAVFDSINLKGGTARLIGNQGSADVIVIPTPSGITFMETTGTGNVVFTTVFPVYKKYSNDFIAVTSRHMNLPGGPLPSQCHGTCKIWE